MRKIRFVVSFVLNKIERSYNIVLFVSLLVYLVPFHLMAKKLTTPCSLHRNNRRIWYLECEAYSRIFQLFSYVLSRSFFEKHLKMCINHHILYYVCYQRINLDLTVLNRLYLMKLVLA